MCRWIAYQGHTIALEHYVTEPAHSLVSQSIQALESTASTNGDGFGLGWYGDHPEPGLYREVRPAWSDENLRYLCRHLRSHLFFAHVRAATGTPIMRPNCHPFACGTWLFMHNGLIGDWSRLRRQIEALIPDELYPSRVGTTDSEAIFLAILGAGVLGPGPRQDPITATVCTLSALTDLMGTPTTGIPFASRRPWRTGVTFTLFATPPTTRPTACITVHQTAVSSSRSRWTESTRTGFPFRTTAS